MATLTIRELDSETYTLLRIRATQHGRSIEAEVREILRALLLPSPSDKGFGSRVQALFAGAGEGLELSHRNDAPRAAGFE